MLNDSFTYRNDTLYCDDVQLDDIADAVGTPVYVYSANRLRQNAQRLQKAFEHLDVSLHYSLKANANLAVIQALKGLGMDAVSGGEIYRALRAGIPAEKIVFAGVGKTRQELLFALENNIGWFNVESSAELALLNDLAARGGKTAQVALRLNPEVAAKTHKHIATGHGGAKFGMAAPEVAQALANQTDYPHLQIKGLHIHIGSQLEDVQETVEAVSRAQELLAPYPAMRTLNIGGGFPVDYTGKQSYPSPEAFAAALTPHLEGWQVKLEPGRFIVADAGVLLINVLYNKTQGETRFVITDGSMSDLIRPALYEAVHPILPLKENTAPTSSANVVGPVCESADVLHRDAPLPDLQPNERLAVMLAGAYGFVMASNYNQRPRPAEVMVRGAIWEVVRRRESWEDLLRLELETED